MSPETHKQTGFNVKIHTRRGLIRRYNKYTFIPTAKRLFSDKYSYDKVVYNSSTSTAIFTCNLHGDFTKSPRSFLDSEEPCPSCKSLKMGAGVINESVEGLIKHANTKFKSKYKYSCLPESPYKKVVITCPKHGEFKMSLKTHTEHHWGCRKCEEGSRKINRIKTDEEWFKELSKIHSGKYKYIGISGKNRLYITYECKKHGEVKQLKSNHKKGGGCKECHKESNSYGYTFSNFKYRAEDKGLSAFYIVKLGSHNESFIKVGITTSPLKDRMYSIPYAYKKITYFKGTPEEVWELEKNFKKNNKQNRYLPSIKFGGYKECFKTVWND